ncbi:MAG: hypothetical protein ACI9J3_002713 [Parvicellaceae bacterium]|jgi:hypothetical protein
MKKIYAIVLSTIFVGGAFAQGSTTTITTKEARTPGIAKTKVTTAPSFAKAPLDTVWSEDFSSGTGWTHTEQGADVLSTDDWAIVNALTPSLVAQVPPYDFPVAMNSGSGGNFALINSDAAGGSATQDAYYTMDGTIDLSALGTTALSIRWTEIYRHFYDENYIEISNDNGVTWTQFAVNPVAEVPVNTSSSDPEFDEINISTANGGGPWGTQVKIRLYYKGQWDWFWGVDDLAIIETAANDLQVNSVKDHYTGAKIKYSKIPMSQVASMAFDARVSNNGGTDQATSQLDVAVSGAGTFTGSSASTNIPVSTNATLSVSGFTPAVMGTYNVFYNVYDPATTDYSPANNVGSSSFEVTQYTYAKDTNVLDGWYPPYDDDLDGVDDPKEFAPEFEFNATETLYGLSVVLMGGGATPQTPVGQEIYYNVYSDDGTGAFVPEYDGLTIPVPTYTITAADLTSDAGSEVWLGLQLPSPVVADPAISPVWYPVVGYAIDSAFFALSGDANDTTNFMTVYASTDGETGYFISSVPMIRFSSDPAFPPSGALGISVEDANVSLSQNMPNPFNSNTVIPFSLVNAATVEFVVTDMMGKIIENRELGTLSNGDHTINFNGSDLASGFYYYSVIVDGKRSTKKFAIAK